jgi:DNA-binding HxlR family transcriptional regulator
VARSYHQYCPIAHALDLVGERWSLLVVRELLARGPLRYSDLHHALPGCGTNILAARLKGLERGGVIRRRRLPAPSASTVYELTEHGTELRGVMNELTHWGLRSLGPPQDESELLPGWLLSALQAVFPPEPADACVEFRIGDEVASYVRGDICAGPAEQPDAVVEGDPTGLYRLLVDRDLEAVSLHGRPAAVSELLATLPQQHSAPALV